MFRRRKVRSFVLRLGASTLVFLASATTMAQDYAAKCALKDIVPSVTTTGVSSIEVAPDVATISLAVVTERPKAGDAAKENATAVQAVVAEIKAQGLDARDIRTTAVSLTPVYDDYREGGDPRPRRVLRGVAARNELSVRVRQIDKVGDLVGKLIDKGANRIEAISFDIDRPEVRYEALRVEAVRDALRKAQSYTTGLGLRLGRVLSIAPPKIHPRPAAPTIALARSTPDGGPVPVPVEPGVSTLSSEVEVVWELVQ